MGCLYFACLSWSSSHKNVSFVTCSPRLRPFLARLLGRIAQRGAKYHDLSNGHVVPKPMPVVNTLIQDKIISRQKRIQRKHVKEVQSVIDTSTPASFYFHHTNAKKLKLAEDREEQIEKANSHLVEKMVEIAEGRGTVDSRLTVDPSFNIPVSLNIKKRIQEIERIGRENVRIKKRIDAAKGSYSKEFPEAHSKKNVPRRKQQHLNRKGEKLHPKKPSAMSPSARGGRKRIANNFLPLFTIGTKLGDLHVKMNIYDKRCVLMRGFDWIVTVCRWYGKLYIDVFCSFFIKLLIVPHPAFRTCWLHRSLLLSDPPPPCRDDTVRINIYEPLSSRQYPMDVDASIMTRIVGEEGAALMCQKTMEAKLMWKNFANQLSLRPVDGKASSVYKLVVDAVEGGPMESGGDDENGMGSGLNGRRPRKSFEIVETEFEFADPTAIPEPDKHDAVVKIQSHFRQVSAQRLVKEMETLKDKQIRRTRRNRGGRGGRKKSPEKKFAEKAEIEMIETYQAQSVIAKHMKGYLTRLETGRMKEEIRKERIKNETSATKIQSVMRKKKAAAVVKERKEQTAASTKLQGLARKRKAKEVVKEKKEQKAASIKLQGIARKRKATAVVKEKKERKAASIKLQGLARKKKAEEIVKEKKEQNAASIKLQGLARKKKASEVARSRKERNEASIKLQGMARRKKSEKVVEKMRAESEDLNRTRLEEEAVGARKLMMKASSVGGRGGIEEGEGGEEGGGPAKQDQTEGDGGILQKTQLTETVDEEEVEVEKEAEAEAEASAGSISGNVPLDAPSSLTSPIVATERTSIEEEREEAGNSQTTLEAKKAASEEAVKVKAENVVGNAIRGAEMVIRESRFLR